MAYVYTNSTQSQVSFDDPRNPEVIIGSELTVPTTENYTRKLYTREQFAGEKIFTHAQDTSNVMLIGRNTYFCYRMGHLIVSPSEMPSFLSKASYESFAKTPCGYMTPQNSVIPKILVPSQNIIDNGVSGTYYEGNLNWTFSGTNHGITTSDSQSSVVIKKGYGVYETQIVLSPNNIHFDTPPEDVDIGNMIGGGAFQIVVGFYDTDIISYKTRSEGYTTPEEEAALNSPDNKAQPKIVMRMGDLEISIDIDGRCVGSFLSGEKNSETINLISGTGEECLPQARTASSDKGKTFTLSVYPVWNGVVIQSGVQSSQNIVHASAARIPVVRKASIFDFAEMKLLADTGVELPFNPLEPDQVLINSYKNGVHVTPDLGDSSTQLIFTAYNCACSVAFAPLYFAKEMRMDHILEGNKDVQNYQYQYQLYPIWAKNGTSYKTDSVKTFSALDKEGPSEFSSYMSATISLKTEEPKFQRVCAEIFGDIVEMQETIIAEENIEPSPYSNGISNWTDYITSVSISNSLDSGESGSITFDKYGATGGDQTTEIQQMVGKINVSVSGSYNTNGSAESDSSESMLFAGYTWEASDNRTVSGAESTIGLVGVQKRLEDIQLVNPPIFDGYKFIDVATYLCEYAGVAYDLTNADQNTRLTISTDPIESVIFNWVTGTDVKQALDQICSNRGHDYFVRDGVLVFFERDSDGSPKYEGTNWTEFTETNIQSVDMNPDFSNLRNQVMLIGMRQGIESGQFNFPDKWPTFPITTMVKTETTPVIPWAKRMCHTLAGYPTQIQIDTAAENVAKSSKKYEITGNTTIAGTNIKLLDRFMTDYLVLSVTHNIDLVSKSWTTTLGLQKKEATT